MSYLSRSGARGGRLRSVTWFDALVLSAPLLFALGYAVVVALVDYRTTLQFDDWWSREQGLERFLTGRLRTAALMPKAVSLRHRMDPEADDANVMRLRVSRAAWEGEVADPFVSDPVWVDATLIRNGSVSAVRVRRRGDTSVHWTTPKVSFTLRTPKEAHARGFRDLALSGKEVLSSHVANTLPAEFDVTTPFSAVVPVFLNEQYYGLFRAVEPVDESFLRRAGRMPGNVFRADLAERGEYFKNVPRNVFINPYIWDRTAVDDVPGTQPLAALRDFLEAVNGSTFDEHLRLLSFVDRDEVARLLAATLVVGDPYHMSGVHNQFWYQDPSTGLLHPIPRDLRILDLQAPGGRLNAFLRAALRDPFLVDRTLAHVYAAVESDLPERIADRLRNITSRFEPYIEYERVRRGLVSDPGTPEEILGQLRRNLATLADWVADSRIRYAITPGLEGELVLDFETAGFAGTHLQGLRFEDPDGDTAGLRLHADTNRNGRLDSADATLAVRPEVTADGAQLRLEEPLELLSGWRAGERGIYRARLHYRLFVTGPGAGGFADRTDVELANRMTGAVVSGERVSAGTPMGGAYAWHPWRYPRPEGRTVRLAGTVTLSETLMLSPDDRLVIEPGTTVRLARDVSIVSRGRVIARGQSDRKIQLAPADEGGPWGALVLQGAGADSSVFRYVGFSGGGGARVGRVDYKGMVSVHRARGVVFEDARFEDNLRSDDALNAVHADVTLERCAFRRANGDAVDYDYSSGAIVGCAFEDSRNDAIDLMTSSPLIASNRIVGSGDKGISIGERSSPWIIDNHILSSVRGLEIKDRSEPLVLHTTIEGNGIGVLVQVKNWRYGGGGWARILYSRVSGNETDLQVDQSSLVTLYESQVGDAPIAAETGQGARWVHASVGATGTRRAGVRAGRPELEPAIAPAWDESFRPRFEQDPAPWSVQGGGRIRRTDGALTGWIERAGNGLGRPVDWDLTDRSMQTELVLELNARDLERLWLTLASEDGETVYELGPLTEAPEVGLITIDVPAGRYRSLLIQGDPRVGAGRVDPRTGLVEQRGGRVDLRRLRLYTLPAGPGASTDGGP
jgi:hypothetical protein